MSWYLILMLVKTGDPYLRYDHIVTIAYPNEQSCRESAKSVRAPKVTAEHLVIVCKDRQSSPHWDDRGEPIK